MWFTNGSGSHLVRVGVWFSTSDGRNISGEPSRFGLPHDVSPGESVTLHLNVAAPPVLGPGSVQMHVGLVKELCFWFRDKGSPDHAVSMACV